MAYGTLPVSVSMPSWLSKEQLIGAAGCAGGLIFSDFVAASVLARAGWTGTTALVASAATKVGLGIAAFYGASKLKGGAQPLLGLASIGCFASVVTDVVARYWPAMGGASARLRAASASRRVVVAAAPRMAAPGIQVRAETPSGIALGGF